jgi:hypothetical protein
MEDQKYDPLPPAQEMDGDGMPSEVDARESALAELEAGMGHGQHPRTP